MSFDKDYASACSRTRLISCTPRMTSLPMQALAVQRRDFLQVKVEVWLAWAPDVERVSQRWLHEFDVEGVAEQLFQRLAVIILGIPVVIYFMETSGSSIFSTTPMFAGPAGRVTEGFRLSR